MSRFIVVNDPNHINIVDVFDEYIRFPCIGHVSKFVGEIAVGLLNARQDIPVNMEFYNQLMSKVKKQAFRVETLGRSFVDGIHAGIVLNKEANPDAQINRSPGNNEAYRRGVLFGQQVIKGEIKII